MEKVAVNIVNLRDEPQYICQYVDLRNANKELLLSGDVGVDETAWWLKESGAHVLIATENDELVGAVVVYLQKDAETAIFCKYKRRGIATALLNEAKKTVQTMYLWAWVADENAASRGMFLKNGFYEAQKKLKPYTGGTVCGSVLRYDMERAK